MQFENRVRIAYALLGVTYLATALSILLSCQPMHKFWQINPDPGSECPSFDLEEVQQLIRSLIDICQPTISKVYVIVSMVLDVFTDIFLLFIPLPVGSILRYLEFILLMTPIFQLLWKVDISYKRKISLTILFSGGVFIVAASVTRAAVILSVCQPKS